MEEKEKLRKMAILFRENADILDELASDATDKDKAEELAALYLAKIVQISLLQ